jgi:hypothetical protein
MKSTCSKCNLPIHTEKITNGKTDKDYLWLHDDYKTAWSVENGYARNLHFAEPTIIVQEGQQQTVKKEGANY